jgi:hypothetical protein
MKTNESLNQVQRSTYAMLVQSEERGLFETVVYGLLVLSAVVGIWQFASQRVPAPFETPEPATVAAHAAVVSPS